MSGRKKKKNKLTPVQGVLVFNIELLALSADEKCVTKQKMPFSFGKSPQQKRTI